MEIKRIKDNVYLVTFKSVSVSINEDSDKSDISIFTNPQAISSRLTLFSTPGEYEVQNCMIDGVRITDDVTAYGLTVDEMHIAYIDQLTTKLSDQQLEAFAAIDVLITTIDENNADLSNKLIAQLEPKLTIAAVNNEKVLEDLQKGFGGEIRKDERFKITKKELNDTDKSSIVVLT